MKEKIENLEKLKKKIIKETKERVWFYSEEYEEFKRPASRHGVKGWFGTQDIFFIGSNPSKNSSKDPHNVNFFFEQLKANKFENAHLTDLVKIRAGNAEAEEVIKKNLKKQKKYLDKEIEILKPKLIVVMGRRCERFIKGLGYKNCCFITHYSAIFYRERFKKEMKDVRKTIFNSKSQKLNLEIKF